MGDINFARSNGRVHAASSSRLLYLVGPGDSEVGGLGRGVAGFGTSVPVTTQSYQCPQG